MSDRHKYSRTSPGNCRGFVVTIWLSVGWLARKNEGARRGSPIAHMTEAIGGYVDACH